MKFENNKFTCRPFSHDFEDTGAGLIHPHWHKPEYVPVQYCKRCGVLRIILKDNGDPKITSRN